MQHGAARLAGNPVAFLAALLLFALALATMPEARANNGAHAPPPPQAKAAAHSTGRAANCMPESLHCQVSAHVACCGMAGCSTPFASLASSHPPARWRTPRTGIPCRCRPRPGRHRRLPPDTAAQTPGLTGPPQPRRGGEAGAATSVPHRHPFGIPVDVHRSCRGATCWRPPLPSLPRQQRTPKARRSR